MDLVTRRAKNAELLAALRTRDEKRSGQAMARVRSPSRPPLLALPVPLAVLVLLVLVLLGCV